jgi:vancomycin resistance protein YoaR
LSSEPPTRPNPISPSPDDATRVHAAVPADATRVHPAVPADAAGGNTAVPDDPAVPDDDATRLIEALPDTPVNDGPTEDRPRRKRRVGLVVTLVLVVLLAGGYAAGYLMAGDRLPRNTTVAGVELGGLSTQEAVDKLTAEFADEANAPIAVAVAGATHEVKPAESGLAIDYAATVRSGGVGKSFSPVHIWRVLTGGGAVKPVVTVDENKLVETVGAIAGAVNKPAVNATVTFEGAEVKRTPAEQAIDLQQEDLVIELKRAYPLETQVTGEVRRTDPTVTDADADKAVQDYATPVLAGPITVNTEVGAFEVTPTMIGNASQFEETDGGLTGRTDAAKLFEQAESAIDDLDLKTARSARYTMEGGTFVVVPSTDGTELTRENFEKVVMPALLSQERNVTAELTHSRAKFTTEEAEKQKPREVIGEFSTSYPHADYRNTNLGLAANRINGNTLAVGEVFSLDKALGNRGAYVDGWVVAGNRLVKQNAGGISQSATTVFNAAWFAGLEDVEHQPHTLYFDRYPAGRESTIYSGSIDVKFRNTTDNAIYVQSYRTPSSSGGTGSITVKIWGTKKWDIVSPTPAKSGFYNGTTITDSSADCTPQSASPGFTATYYRLFQVNGETVKREDKSWKYNATNQIRCV